MEIEWDIEGHSGIIAHTNERIKYIPDFPGYFVSTEGNVYSAHCKNFTINYNKLKKKKAFVSDKKRKRGYLMVSLSYNGNPSLLSVHRLVAKAFIPNPHKLPVVDHLYHHHDNKATSLQWSLQSDNCDRGTKPKYHMLVDPNGNTITIRNLAKFARENGLNTSGLYCNKKDNGWIYLGSI